MSKNKPKVSVIGAGLAGCEAAYQLAERGIAVSLYEMKPEKFSPAHKLNGFCELVCSNSLRSDRLQNGAGLLKEEMRRLGSIVMQCAEESRVPAGGALAVDRDIFSELVTKRLSEHENITIEHGEVTSIPDAPAIVATGPLTDGAMLEAIEAFFGEGLHFYDAVAPVISAESLDMSKIFEGSRYERGNDYLNCPMDKEEYFTFINNLITAETAPLHEFETPRVFEGCMPVEVMAKRGPMTLAYGPLKPVGIVDPRTGKRPYAVVQLRQDNADTRLTPLGHEIGLIREERYRKFLEDCALRDKEIARVKALTLAPSEALNAYLVSRETAPLSTGAKLADLIRRPPLGYRGLAAFDPERPDLPDRIAEQVETEIKYEGYIKRQLKQVEQFKKLETRKIPADIDYDAVPSLRIEAVQKLKQFRPLSIGQASRISGVSPADISVLLVYLGH